MYKVELWAREFIVAIRRFSDLRQLDCFVVCGLWRLCGRTWVGLAGLSCGTTWLRRNKRPGNKSRQWDFHNAGWGM